MCNGKQWIVGAVVLAGLAAHAAGQSLARVDFASAAAASTVVAADPLDKPALSTTEGLGDWWRGGWTHNADVGFFGSEGNSESFSGRAGLGMTRLASDMESRAGINYQYATTNSQKSKSRGEAFIRNDYIYRDSKWGFWAQGKLEYDEFQAWDWRASAYAGPSYTFIKNDRTLLRGRAGLGVSYEFGGQAKEGLKFEGLLGLDYEQKLSERAKIYASVEWIPSISDWADYRLNANAGYEILVDPESKMTLKLGLADRYDINPGDGRKKNDFEYFGMLSWAF